MTEDILMLIDQELAHLEGLRNVIASYEQAQDGRHTPRPALALQLVPQPAAMQSPAGEGKTQAGLIPAMLITEDSRRRILTAVRNAANLVPAHLAAQQTEDAALPKKKRNWKLTPAGRKKVVAAVKRMWKRRKAAAKAAAKAAKALAAPNTAAGPKSAALPKKKRNWKLTPAGRKKVVAAVKRMWKRRKAAAKAAAKAAKAAARAAKAGAQPAEHPQAA